jgi:hypothetical protein
MTCLDRHREGTVVQLQPIRNPALEGRSAPLPGRFTFGKATVPTVHGTGWASGPVWTARKISPPPAFYSSTVQLYGLRSPGRVYISPPPAFDPSTVQLYGLRSPGRVYISPPPAFDPSTVHLYGVRYPDRVYIYMSNSKFLKVRWNDHDTSNSRYVCDRELDLQFSTEFLVK